MNTLSKYCSIAILAFASSTLVAEISSSDVPSVTFGEAADFNIVAFGDFSSPYYSSTTGRMAIKGDLNLNNYGLATAIPGDDQDISVIVGGNFDFEYGKIYGGHTLVSGSAEQVSTIVRNGLTDSQVLLDNVDGPFDFSDLEVELISRSRSLSELPASGQVVSQYGGLYLTGDCESPLQVFDVDGDLMLAAHTFQVSCIPENASIVFNISGTSTGMSYMSLEPLKPMRERILYNFYEATSLTLTSMGVEGSILAPMADANNPTGQLHGTVIVKSWNGPMHLDYVRYTGFNENVRECEGPLSI